MENTETVASTEATEVESTEAQTEQAQPDEGQEAAPALEKQPGETKAEHKARVKKLKLKVDGEEFDEELPFEVDEEHAAYLQKQLQLAKMAQKRASEKASIEKEAEEFFNLLRSNPRAILENPNLGIDLKKFVNDYINEELENAKKSPEQLEKERLIKELAEERRLREQEKKEIEEQRLKELTTREYERFEASMEAAFAKNPDLPKSPFVVEKISQYMLAAIDAGIPASVEEVVPYVKQELRAQLSQLTGSLPDELVEEIMGGDRITNIYKKKAAAAKKTAAVSPQLPKKVVDTGGKPVEAAKPAKKMTIKDMFKV